VVSKSALYSPSPGLYSKENLVVTYDQFVASGIRRESISTTIAELERLGWIEVTRGGYHGFARSWPHRFRLTHRRTRINPGSRCPLSRRSDARLASLPLRKIESNGAGTGTGTVPKPAL
jgi:hypothetical protein